MPPTEIRQGEIWRVGFYEGGERPAVVVSRNETNRGSLLLVVPITSSRVAERRLLPNHVFLAGGSAGLSVDSVAQTHLVQPVERSALLQSLGTLDRAGLQELLMGVAWTVGLFEAME